MKIGRNIMIALVAAGAVSLSACSKEETQPKGSQTAGADRCPHSIRANMCPFCTPSLVESDGFCGEHGVPEALCYQCRPYLKTAFRAKGDWCAHDVPRSQCPVCTPAFKDKAEPGTGHGAAHPTGG